MQKIYDISAQIIERVLPVSALFNEKIKKFVSGRKQTFDILRNKIFSGDKVIWFHVASLGEYEQGLPIMEVCKRLFPTHKIVISFFSPSGYENKKNSPVADAIVYLPLDTPSNVQRFLDAVHPELAIFIKYEFWPNYLKELKSRNIPSILVSGGFREEQLFFKSYGSWMRESLKTFDHLFVQNQKSKDLLQSIGFENVSLSGDTRFDRVARQLEQDNSLPFIERFIDGKTCLVAGSTWPEDEALLEGFINKAPADLKVIIAPHEINSEKIKKLKHRFNPKTTLHSERDTANLKDFQIYILDTIGLLSRVYSYADIAYVGGAAGNTGLHNILEPATFGIPIIIGKNFKNFPEAIQLQKMAGLYAVENAEELQQVMRRFLQDNEFRIKTGMITGHFVQNNTGATRMVEQYLKDKFVKNR